METTATHTTFQTPSKAGRWTGRVIYFLCILFLLFDAIMKVIREAHSIDGSAKIGWPVDSIQGLGLVLLGCTVLYIIPRTAVFGAILLTGYLGGATAINLRAGYSYMFPVIFGVMIWLGLYLQDGRLAGFLFPRKNSVP
jgi:hypothetical protein